MSRNVTIVVIILIIVLLAAYLVWLRGRYSATNLSPSPEASVEMSPSPVLSPSPTASASASPVATKSGSLKTSPKPATKSGVPAK
jgi:hypothetical protein